MIKSWADHCSSDEESDDGTHHPARSEISPVVEETEEEASVEDLLHEDGGPLDPEQLDFSGIDLPSRPPFTAHISNLSFKIKDEQTLGDEVQMLAKFRYRMLEDKGLIHVVGARFGMDRGTGNRKGFGYVDVEDVEELKLLLCLNDGFSEILGRPVRIQLATSSHTKKNWNSKNKNDRQGVPDVDGSAFQGGRFSNRNKSSQNNNDNRDKKDAPPRQRKTLQLKPRTVPSDVEIKEKTNSNRGNIFGRAKPRDETSKNENTTTEALGSPSRASANKTKSSLAMRKDSYSESASVEHKTKGGRGGSNNNGRGARGRSDSKDLDRRNKDAGGRGGRGGRGKVRGGGNKGGGKGDDKQNNTAGRKKTGAKGNSRSNDKPTVDNSSKKPANALPVQQTEKKKATKSLNAFAALGFDSDSD